MSVKESPYVEEEVKDVMAPVLQMKETWTGSSQRIT